MDIIKFTNGAAELKVSALFKKDHGRCIVYIPALNLADEGPTRDRAADMVKEAISIQIEDLRPCGDDFLAHYEDLGWKRGDAEGLFVLPSFNNLPPFVLDIMKEGYLSCDHDLDEIEVKVLFPGQNKSIG